MQGHSILGEGEGSPKEEKASPEKHSQILPSCEFSTRFNSSTSFEMKHSKYHKTYWRSSKSRPDAKVVDAGYIASMGVSASNINVAAAC